MGGVRSGLLGVTTFILGRADLPVGGMALVGVIEALDVGEHLTLGLGAGGEAGAVDQFGLQGGEEALGDGVVEA